MIECSCKYGFDHVLLQEILKTANISRVAQTPAVQQHTVPAEPEQIPFVPASQRQSLSTKFAEFTSTPARHVEIDDDEVVEVKDPELKKKSKNKKKKEREKQDTKTQLAKMSLLAAAAPVASASSEQGSLSNTPPGDKTVEDEDERLELKKRKREEKERKKKEAAEALEAVAPYDYGTAANPLDEGLDEQGATQVPSKKRKVGKGEKRKGKQGEFLATLIRSVLLTSRSAGANVPAFPAPPRQLTMPKSGNKSMTFKS